eukprot:scaffold25972_cov27-Phaeocystis_antarctica.AAC.1
MSDFGGGSLEHPRAMAGVPVAGLQPGSVELPRATRRARTEEVQGPSWGAAQEPRARALPRERFDHAEPPMTEKALERLPISMSTSPSSPKWLTTPRPPSPSTPSPCASST